MLDPLPETGRVFERASKRGFVTYTGMFGGVRISVVATGRGSHSSTFRLNVSAFCEIRGEFVSCLGVV
jgi:purine-nucleoside phosphorylase